MVIPKRSSRIEPTIIIRQSGKSLEALATAPAGYSWNGIHELVVSWHMGPGLIATKRAAIRGELMRRVRSAGDLSPCPVGCDCEADSANRITCRHERDGVPHNVLVDDFHSLTWTDVRALLVEAHRLHAIGDIQKFFDIQCRFAQAIPGATCPLEIEGWTAKRTALMDELFVHTATFEVCNALVDLFMWLMTDHRKADSAIGIDPKP